MLVPKAGCGSAASFRSRPRSPSRFSNGVTIPGVGPRLAGGDGRPGQDAHASRRFTDGQRDAGSAANPRRRPGVKGRRAELAGSPCRAEWRSHPFGAKTARPALDEPIAAPLTSRSSTRAPASPPHGSTLHDNAVPAYILTNELRAFQRRRHHGSASPASLPRSWGRSSSATRTPMSC